MKATATEYKEEIIKEMDGLPSDKIKEVLDFVYFLKAKDSIDPSQMYFWTKKWQEMEKQADNDREEGNIIGSGTVKDLLAKLKK